MSRALLALIFFASCLGCAKRIDTKEILPIPTKPPIVKRVSEIAIRASVSISSFQSPLNDALPAQYSFDETLHARLPVWPFFKVPVSFKGTISRGPIDLTMASPKVGFTSKLTGSGSAPVYWRFKGAINGSLQPMVSEDYSIHSNIESSAAFEEAKLILSNLPDISVRGKLEELYRNEMVKQVAKLDQQINAAADLLHKMTTIWESAHGVSSIQGDFPMFLTYQPIGVSVANAEETADGQLHLGVNIKGQLQLVVGSEPTPQQIKDLPRATKASKPGNRLKLTVPIVVDMHGVAEAFTRRLEKQVLELDGGTIHIVGVQAAVRNKRLLVRASVNVKSFWKRIDAIVFLECTPYIDSATRELRVRDVEYTVESRNLLLKIAAILVSPNISNLFEKSARMPLVQTEVQAKAAADTFAVNIGRRSKGLVTIRIESVRLGELVIVSDYLIIDAYVLGRTSTKLALFKLGEYSRTTAVYAQIH